MDNNTLYTITVYSENHVGLLSQIATVFTRRRLNIESLSVSASAIDGVHKFTITTYSDQETVVNVVKQIEKRIDVIRAFHYTDDEVIFQEIALYKVSTSLLLSQGGLEQIVRKYGVKILEVNENFTVIEKSGQRDETQQLYEDLSKYKMLQFVRSGRVAITKSTLEPVSSYLESQLKRKTESENKK